jgi:hypothetical protein
LSISQCFSFNRLKVKAPAEAVNTEKSKAPFIPVEKIIEIANMSNRNPLNLAKSSVLNPTIKQIEKIISVASISITEIVELGNQGFISSILLLFFRCYRE